MKKILRGVALAAAATLAATTASVTGTAPASAAETPAAPSAATWLAGELTNGLMYNPNFGGFDDYGLSIDTGLALKAVGGRDAVVGQISAALAPKIGSYTTGVDFGSSDIYAGASAKALVFAQTAGADPTTYGGVNLVARTADRVSTTAPLAGRIEDATTGTDFANVIGQAFAARGLSAAASPRAASALSFLLKQQCAGGFFRLGFAPKTDPNQSCTDGAAGSTPDADVTSLAVLQLAAIKSPDASVTSAITKATAWLSSQQKSDGSFGGGPSTADSNANSTGLAAWVLGDQGSCVAAGRAGAWIKDLQVRANPAGSPLNTDVGAVAYDKAALTTGQAAGITDATADQWRRTSAQAAPGLAYALTSGAGVTFAGPTAFQREGTQVALTATGVTEGERTCLTGPGITGTRSLVAGAAGLSTSVVLPGGTTTAGYTFTTRNGSVTVGVKVLGKTRLKVEVKKKKVRRGQKQKIVVRGLVAGEKATVKVGKVTRTGVANRFGAYKVTLKVNKKLIKKLPKSGKVKVKARGQFKDLRQGAGKFRLRR